MRGCESLFCCRMQEESNSADDGKDFNLTLTLDDFRKLCIHMNPRLREEDLDEILKALPILKALDNISHAQIADLAKESEMEETPESEVMEVAFPLFVRSVTWMYCKFPAMQEVLKL
eukprot:symbB.v1.2.016600.t1/scaffold1214.1/size131888/7